MEYTHVNKPRSNYQFGNYTLSFISIAFFESSLIMLMNFDISASNMLIICLLYTVEYTFFISIMLISILRLRFDSLFLAISRNIDL